MLEHFRKVNLLLPETILHQHVLHYSNELVVSQAILDLNAVSLYSVTRSKQDPRLKELEQRGLLILGKHNLTVQKTLAANFATLVKSSQVRREHFLLELFPAEGPGGNPGREFVMKRQLFGFFLLQGLNILNIINILNILPAPRSQGLPPSSPHRGGQPSRQHSLLWEVLKGGGRGDSGLGGPAWAEEVERPCQEFEQILYPRASQCHE